MPQTFKARYRRILGQYSTDFFGTFASNKRGKRVLPSIERFLADEPCKENALAVYEAFLNAYLTPGLRPLSDQMREYEEKVAPTIPQHRDHYVHSVQVLLLGLAIYQRNQSFRDTTKACTYADSYSTVEEFFYRWSLAALFHDIGYPVEIAYRSIQEYARFALVPDLGQPGSTSGQEPAPRIVRPVFSLAIENLDNLLYLNQLWPLPTKEERFFTKYPDYESLVNTDILVLLADNLSRHFNTFRRKPLARMLRDYLVQGMAQGNVDHGLLSAIILLKWIGTLYLRSGWNPIHFYLSALDAAAGISLHNLYDYFLMQYPFNLEPLTASVHPLGYLLILCDRLQETDRPEYGFYTKECPPLLTAENLFISDSQFVMQFAARRPGTRFEEVCSAVERCEESIRRVLDVSGLFDTFHLEVQDPSLSFSE